MATVLETIKRKKILTGTITEIKEESNLCLVKVAFEESQEAVSEIPRNEFILLGIKVGDKVQLFPMNQSSYLIVGTE